MATATRSKTKTTTANINAACFNHQYAYFDVNLWQTDILKFTGADCLVNCTGPYFQHTSGVSKKICKEAGESDLERKFANYLTKNRVLKYKEVFVTRAYDLKHYKHIFHIASPYDQLPEKLEILMTTIMQILSMAFVNKGLKSIAMPLIGTGNNGIQLDEFLEAFFCALDNFVRANGSPKAKQLQINLITIMPNIDSFDSLIASYIQNRKLTTADSSSEEKATIVAKNEKDEKEEEKQDVAGAIVDNGTKQEAKPTKDEENCVICMDVIINERKLIKCGHKFCTDCIEAHFKSGSQSCPTCGTVYGINKGTQPTNATMQVGIMNQPLPGYENFKTIVITYNVPNGIQGPEHPHPGVPYIGTTRTAYLPDNTEGREIVELLRIAFNNRLIFTVGQSRTTNVDNIVTWNDIHHKTSMTGGTSCFGYPDSSYLYRVRQELAAKGVIKN